VEAGGPKQSGGGETRGENITSSSLVCNIKVRREGGWVTPGQFGNSFVLLISRGGRKRRLCRSRKACALWRNEGYELEKKGRLYKKNSRASAQFLNKRPGRTNHRVTEQKGKEKGIIA